MMGSLIEKFREMIGIDETEEYEEEVEYEEEEESSKIVPFSSRVNQKEKSKTVNVINTNVNVQMKVALIIPEDYEDAKEICDSVKENKAVIVNLEKVENGLAQQIVDFLSGVCYALDGSLQKISNKIFLIAPENVDITGDFKEEIKAKAFSWMINK